MKTQDEASDLLLRKAGAYLPETVFQAPDEGHTDWPAKLDPHQIQPDNAPFLFVETSQPFQNRLSPCGGAIEAYRNLGWLLCRHTRVYQNRYIP